MIGIARGRLAVFAIAAIVAGTVLHLTAQAVAGPAASLDCRAAQADTEVHDFDPSLRDAALTAYRALFPHASAPPSDSELADGTKVRCMGGHLLLCFTGANLPCDRMNASRDNVGADAFCRSHRQAGDVPLVATGHDTIFAYRCEAGRSVVSGQTYHLDGQGYAKEMWAGADAAPPPTAWQPSSAAQPALPTNAADLIEERSKACFASPAGQTTSGMAACSHEAYLAYDSQLNTIYQGVLKHVDPASATLIREAQRQWVALQAADLAADNGPWRNDRGSMATPDIEALRIDAIRQRIVKLRYYVHAP